MAGQKQPYRQNRVQIAVWLEPEVKAALDELCIEKKISQTQVVSDSLKRIIAKRDTNRVTQKQRRT